MRPYASRWARWHRFDKKPATPPNIGRPLVMLVSVPERQPAARAVLVADPVRLLSDADSSDKHVTVEIDGTEQLPTDWQAPPAAQSVCSGESSRRKEPFAKDGTLSCS